MFFSYYISENEVCVWTSRIASVLCKNSTNVINFNPLEVVGSGSETQLQEDEK